MLSDTLNTNEIKNAAGVEVEFETQAEGPGRVHEFRQIGESPALPYRLRLAHSETGAGLTLRKRSLLRVDKRVMSTVDSAVPVTVSAYVVLDTPIGAMTTDTEFKNVLATLISAIASTGADTVIKFDCSGTFAKELVSGGI